MKAVIALVLALALLAIGIPLSRSISAGDPHTITRTVEPLTPAQERQASDRKLATNAADKRPQDKTAGIAPPSTR